eukprot:694492-Rhodomonas_salina.2
MEAQPLDRYDERSRGTNGSEVPQLARTTGTDKSQESAKMLKLWLNYGAGNKSLAEIVVLLEEKA